ncbi:unnamed protein product [Prorocentrum cordatum]|uniref:HTTM domain-containing protein n=1 Tax=Prorocentrum cordatum TaxID=2364126 RepID=A0ABN9T307_9DINO|nr:unnamed protein product [Polarella glacialis]
MMVVSSFLPAFLELSPIRQFQVAWCSLIAISLMVDFPRQLKFYRWFSGSGLEMAGFRGYGQTAGKFFGVLPAPRLSVACMALSGVGLVASLVLASTDVLADPRPLLAVALLCYHCYVPQLYCEIHMVAHNTCLIPPALLVLLLSPDLAEPRAAQGAAAAAQQWPLFLLRLVITSAYCSAALCKIWAGMARGVSWLSGATMQACVFEAIMGINLPLNAHMTFCIPTPYARVVQRWLFSKPFLLGLMSIYGVLIELVAPVVLLVPALNIPFALAGLGLHYGIAYCQNIDFLPWWGPYYACFFFGDQIVAADILGVGRAYAQANPICFGLGVAYATVHIAAMVVHRYFPGLDILPLSSFPMFSTPKNLWDGSFTHWAWLTEKEHQPGTLMNFAFPMHGRKHYVLPSELDSLPFKYLLFGDPRAPGAHKDLAPELTVYTNVVLTEALTRGIGEMFDEWHTAQTATKTPPGQPECLPSSTKPRWRSATRHGALRARRLGPRP